MKEDEIEDNFFTALLVTLGYMALLLLLIILIPLVGIIVFLTIGAYIAGYKGAKYSVDWRKVGLLAAVIWITFLIIIFFVALTSLPPPLTYDVEIGGWEVALICIPYALSIVFCVAGARARVKGRAVYI
jgi:hypothetical protein